MVEIPVNVETKLSVQTLFEGAQEVLGAERLQEARNRCASIKDVGLPAGEAAGFLHVLEEMFGLTAAHGLALRIGRAAFPYWLKDLDGQGVLRSQEYRFLPAPRRIDTGLQVLAGVLGELFGEEVILSDEGGYWLWRAVDQRQAGFDTACYLKVGLLQEFASWAGGGRFYPVTRTECRASGCSACVYRIEKKPLD
jgi:hypothetical protein